MSSYGIEFTGKEMLYFFFKKKKCPVCGEMMKRENKVESLGEGVDNAELGKYYSGERHEVTLFYRCQKCDKLYSIGELSGITRKDQLDNEGGCLYDDRFSFC